MVEERYPGKQIGGNQTEPSTRKGGEAAAQQAGGSDVPTAAWNPAMCSIYVFRPFDRHLKLGSSATWSAISFLPSLITVSMSLVIVASLPRRTEKGNQGDKKEMETSKWRRGGNNEEKKKKEKRKIGSHGASTGARNT